MKTKEELASEKSSLALKHKRLYTIEVPLTDEDDAEIATIFLKKPDRQVYSAAAKMANGSDPFRAIEVVIKNCYVGGDSVDLVLKNDEAIISCENAVLEIFKKREAVLKKN